MRKLRVCFSFVFVAVVVAGLAACGDDDSDLSSRADSGDAVLSFDDLTNCTAKKAGALEFVKDTPYVCVESDDKFKWEKVSQTEDEPEDFKVCNQKREGQYALASNEDVFYVCSDEEWIPLIQFDDEVSSSSGKENGSSSSKSKSSNSGKDTESSSSVSSSSGKKASSSSAVSSTSTPSSFSTGMDESAYDSHKNLLTDYRDGHVYKTITIEVYDEERSIRYSEVWMAQNLNYAYLADTASFCFDDQPAKCDEYGRYYIWAAAMDSAGVWTRDGADCGKDKFCSPTYPVRGVCPKGWHLPRDTEWKTLVTAVGGDSVAGTLLKSTSGWDGGGNGTDAYGFSALPSGGYGGSLGGEALIWSSTEGGAWKAYHLNISLSYGDAYARVIQTHKGDAISVRCIKDYVSIDSSLYDAPRNTLTDYRDGNVYRTVTIGSQIWMAENLNYARTPRNENDSTSWCYRNDPVFCDKYKYGRLYKWSTAMNNGVSGSKTPVRGVCPKGWHLPDTTEWKTLCNTVGGASIAGKKLKSASGWLGANGTDEYSFTARPAGYRSYGGDYNRDAEVAYFWSSIEYDYSKAYHLSLEGAVADLSRSLSNYGYSVRCLKD
ncbi:MAG: hypothetical protein II835_03290 [Fibrobacter sp.]|nr:hypothetical protein [Fibrobacter sp.]